MSGIVLSASVRQNLLSLQSTASLLATTQNDLATGNKVNSALDNPTNYFTAQTLNNRASDISNLLDSIGNGVQVLQAANTGITSLQSLVASAKSIANQVLQTSVGYSTLSSVTSAAVTSGGAAATANNLLGAGTTASNSVTGTATTATTPVVAATLSTKLSALGITSDQKIGFSVGYIDFSSTTGTHVIPSTSNTAIDLSTATVQDFITAANLADNGSETWALNGSGHLTVTAAGGATGSVNNGGSSGTALTALGLSPTSWINTDTTFGALTTGGSGPITAASTLTSLASAITTSDTLTVNGKTISFVNTGAGNSISANGATIDLASATVSDVLTAIDTITGTGTASTVSGGEITLNTGTSSDLTLAGTALAKLGLSSASGTTRRTGLTLDIGATGGGTATSITFGTGAGQISHAERAQHGAGGQQPAGHDRCRPAPSPSRRQQRGLVDDRCDHRHRDRRPACLQRPDRGGSGGGSERAGDPRRAGLAVQQHPVADRHHVAGLLVQRHQPAGRRYAEADLRRDRQVHAEHPGRHLQCRGPWPLDPDRRHRLPGQQLGEHVCPR